VWAAAILHVRGHRWAGTPLDLAPWQMLVALPPLAVLAWLVEGPPQADMSATFLWVAAYNGPLATAFAFWAAITVTRMLPAITVSLAFLCVPVAGLVFSALMLGEGMSAGNLLGLALVAGGVAVVAVGDAKRK
jgi:drug/metabolite transporter (DMT)-like permease